MKIIQKARKFKKYLIFFVFMRCSLMMAWIPVHAEETVSVKLPVSQTFRKPDSTVFDEGGIFAYKLTASSAETPMPAGSIQDEYQFSLKNDQSLEIEPMTYSQTGIYMYRLELVTDSEKTGYIYDKEVYFITVYVTYTENDSLVTAVIAKNLAGNKVGSLDFHHAYQALTSDSATMVDPPVKKTVSCGTSLKNPGYTSVVKTGDSSNIVIWIVILAMAATGILVAVAEQRKKK